MASDKDKKKEAPPSKTGHDVLWEIVGFFFALFIVASAISGFSIFDYVNKSSSPVVLDGTTKSVSGDYSFWSNLIGATEGVSFDSASDLALGNDVISKGLIQVRREPGGSVIGLQKRGAMAKIADGPIFAYGAKWWMVDYEEPPSGWVDEKDITNKFFSYYVINFFPILWGYIKILSLILSVFFGIVIVYVAIKEMFVPSYDTVPIIKEEEPITEATPITTKASPPSNLPTSEYEEPSEENAKWKHVELLLKSHNSSDWRQAIIEADVMLEDMLDKMGYPGVGIGEKLKNVEENDFQTLDKAWEAHKVRNRIAHDGSGLKFPYNEAVRVVGLYHDVFKEFYWM